MIHPDRVNVLGVGVSAINMADALEFIDQSITEDARTYVCVCNVHSVMECRRSPELLDVFARADLVTPDGMPLVWIGRRSHPNVSRVYGPDLMLAELARSAPLEHRHFFYGGRPGVASALALQMRSRFPGLQIVGVLEPPVASLDDLATQQTADSINVSGANVVWVGIGSPKQESWMARMRPLLRAQVLLGVGAAFDFHSGSVQQAPRWMMRMGLEWLYRLFSDPRRLWRRYVIDNPWFVWEFALQNLGLRRYKI